jgi:predicted metal-binding protein
MPKKDAASRGNPASELIAFAESRGADRAEVMRSGDIVIDKRVRLKCAVPVCSSYGRHLLCPPNLMPVDEFEAIVRSYSRAIIMQVEDELDSSDRSGKHISKELDDSIGPYGGQRKLHRLVNEVEAAAFKKGFYLAAGFIAGECLLCPECIGQASGKPCRRPFEARPSMEAMGVDVLRTCENAGLSVHLSSKEKIRWTGLVLLD